MQCGKMPSVVSLRSLVAGLLSLALVCACHAQADLGEINAEHDPAKRAELAIVVASAAFDDAREAYLRDNVAKGDAQLDSMMNALNLCVDSLSAAHKARFYKKPELRVAYLQRRMAALLDDIELQRRGWAEQTSRKLEEVHEKLLEGVMRK